METEHIRGMQIGPWRIAEEEDMVFALHEDYDGPGDSRYHVAIRSNASIKARLAALRLVIELIEQSYETEEN